ncbi:PopZ family protein [Rhizobium binxianense]
MAQPGVAREPSMEEILASIRQIIESNEPGAGKAISASLPPVYGADEETDDSDIHLTVDDAYAGVEFPEAPLRSDPRFVAANSAGTAPEADAPVRALSLADVAARVRAASERSAIQAGQALRDATPAFGQPELRTAPAPETPRVTPALQPVEAASAPAAIPPVPELSAEAKAALAEAVLAPQPVPEEVGQAAETDDRFLPSVLEEEPPALLSEGAGLQVARSFEELAVAIDGAAQRRSLDEIAEEMLRPMLREWLDDNLPTLVERLVREEIERVARGPRR